MTIKPTVLVVDDSAENIELLSHMLHEEYKVKAALHGDRAIHIAKRSPHPDMILLDIMMPGMDGYEVCQRLKEDPITSSIPIIFISAMTELAYEKKGLELGAVDYITKPFNPSIVLRRIQTHMSLYDQRRALAFQVREYTDELYESRVELIHRLGRVAELKDNETGMHVIRMSHYTKLIAEALDETDDWKELLFQVAPMHDIGKIGVADNVLLKPGKLNEEEWEMMQRHAVYGANIIGEHHCDILRLAKQVALNHHEKWDGSGYPNAIKGIDIPLSARVVAIADVFDALTSERPYKKAWTFEEAFVYIEENSGKHFDPELVKIFIDKKEKVRKIMKSYHDDSAMNIITMIETD
ncbi:MAG: response regulator [Gammaproteobacteria bacterium]|nr:response regulator [Gammaproteobacteria bacterium]